MRGNARAAGRRIARAVAVRRLRETMSLALPLCFGVVLWLQALHAALGAREHAEHRLPEER